MEEALQLLRRDLAKTHELEETLRGKRKEHPDVKADLLAAQQACDLSRKRFKALEPQKDLSDDGLSKLTRHTDVLALEPYRKFLHFVPRLVNNVSLAEALPVPGTGLKLPLDLRHIASKCAGAYYAPKRFAAVQLAYSSPRARVLVFHTGRLVGTGATGSAAARLAIVRAQRQLADEAGIHIFLRSFSIINQVGAVSLRASLNCEGFATAHSSYSHFDRQSFVGLAWRPPGEKICCEIYSTGRANLPGSVALRECMLSFSRMLPELLRFSSSAHLLKYIPADIQKIHRSTALSKAEAEKKSQLLLKKDNLTARTARAAKAQRILAPPNPIPQPDTKPKDLWDGWTDATEEKKETEIVDEDYSGIDLSSFGL